MEINLSNLVLEITRRCNMRCMHCLRGPAQPVDMDLEIISRITKSVKSIGCVSFTGGEPSLNAKAIEYFRWAKYYNNVDLDIFWLKTNARFFKKDFYDAIYELYFVCDLKDECSLVISVDQFHVKQSYKAVEIYAELPFFKNCDSKQIPDAGIISEGIAAKNQIGWREIKVPAGLEESTYYTEDDSLYVNDLIYVNVKGDVLLCCDLSYVRQKKHVIGNILQESLEDILMRNMINKQTAA